MEHTAPLVTWLVTGDEQQQEDEAVWAGCRLWFGQFSGHFNFSYLVFVCSPPLSSKPRPVGGPRRNVHLVDGWKIGRAGVVGRWHSHRSVLFRRL